MKRMTAFFINTGVQEPSRLSCNRSSQKCYFSYNLSSTRPRTVRRLLLTSDETSPLVRLVGFPQLRHQELNPNWSLNLVIFYLVCYLNRKILLVVIFLSLIRCKLPRKYSAAFSDKTCKLPKEETINNNNNNNNNVH